MRVLKFIVGLFILAHVVNFLAGGRTVAEPREIDPSRITPPGTELRLGEEAYVPMRFTYHGRERDGIVAITVTAIEPGDQDLFDSEVENATGYAPYYVRATVENVSDEDLGDAVIGSLGVVRDGAAPDAVLFDPNFLDPGMGDCRTNGFPSRAGIGTIIETCDVDVMHRSRTPDAARWQRYGTPYQSEPIIWRS